MGRHKCRSSPVSLPSVSAVASLFRGCTKSQHLLLLLLLLSLLIARGNTGFIRSRPDPLSQLNAMVHHSDEFRDTFPIVLSRAMHEKAMTIRQKLRLELADLDAVRGTEPVRPHSHQNSHVNSCTCYHHFLLLSNVPFLPMLRVALKLCSVVVCCTPRPR